ncbi:MAG: 16S rRNA (uracil(1498)-N(3))-methyltransferase [Chitinivibrionia bacterium]|nr:16S rRNA (uracil(1498)-N(3))-methyltransferase [Chitinivibrionia bacterium]
MNLMLIKPNDFVDENLVEISDFRFEHIKKILKLKISDTIKTGVLNGKIGAGKITKIDEKSVKLEILLDKEPPPINPSILFCALPRPKVFRRVLLNAVCFGVKEIHFFQAFKVEKSYWQSPFLSQDSINKIVENALMQSVDTILPEIYFHRLFKNFVEDVFYKKTQKFPCFVFHPTAENLRIFDCNSKKCGFVIGPEGGFTYYEIELFLKNNAKIASLGDRILRVEQAVCSVLGFNYSGNLQ